jgi:hypothetical protein
MPKPKSPTQARPQTRPQPQPQALQTIDPTALANVSGGARSGRTASSAGGGGGGGGSGGGNNDAVLGALTGILDSLNSLAHQSSSGFSPQEMMLMMMVMQQRNSAPVQVVQPALPAIYTNGTTRVF